MNQPINNLPETLESLVISHFDILNTHYLPASLKKLKIIRQIKKEEYFHLMENFLNKNLNIKNLDIDAYYYSLLND